MAKRRKRNGIKGGCDYYDWRSHRGGWYGGHTTYRAEPAVEPEKKIALQKMMVAHYIEEVPEDCQKNIKYVMQGDGLYEIRSNRLGTFTTRLAEVEIPGLYSELEEGWELNVPKIPAALLGTTVAFFRQIYKKHSSEVFLQFYYDMEEDDYIIHCPKQTITMASVRYENDEMFEDENKILVFEIHSHGNMGAFFSGTDDSDEKADRFYGVIGNITNFFPDLKLRLSIGGHKAEVDVEDLFDLDEEMYHAESYPKDWVDRIKKEKIKVVRYSGRRGVRNGWGHRWSHPGVVGTSHQLPMWDGVDEDEIDQMIREHYYDQNYLSSSQDFWDDGEVEIVSEEDAKNAPGGYFAQEGDKLWKIENGKKMWYIQGGHKYTPGEVEAEEDDDEIEEILDPHDWRGKRF